MEDAFRLHQDNISAISVPIGPGSPPELQVGIDMACWYGQQYDIPVIPVSHYEAKIFSFRRELATQGLEFPPYPYLSLVADSQRTETILTHGVGQHTILGLSLDSSAGNTIDLFAREIRQSLLKIGQEDLKTQIEDFITRYNSVAEEKIESTHFDALIQNKPMCGGQLVEMLARYGNPEHFDFPTPLKFDKTCDFSFSGLWRYASSLFYHQSDPATGLVKSRA